MIPQAFDRTPAEGTTMQDVNLETVVKTIQCGQELGRYDGRLDPIWYLLQYSGATLDTSLFMSTIAALVAFSDAPDSWRSCGINLTIHASQSMFPLRAHVAQQGTV